jgi:hypothetical protein
MSAIWAAGSKLKNFERLVYRFTGEKDEDSVEFRAYLVFARETWETVFRDASTTHYETPYFKRFIKKNWTTFKSCYPHLSQTPSVPVSPKHVAPHVSKPCECHSVSPEFKSKPSRLRKARSGDMKTPTSSFEFDTPGPLATLWGEMSGNIASRFTGISSKILGGGRK